MQDKFDNFDQQIRSMIQDAEVKPSPRVWKAVSARIAAPKAIWGGWNTVKWAGAGLAFAAAIALGVFFTGSQEKTEIVGSVQSLVAEVQSTQAITHEAEETMVTEASVAEEVKADKRAIKSQKTELKEETVQLIAADTKRDATAQAETQVQKPEEITHIFSEEVGDEIDEQADENQQFVDPFALLDQEEKQPRSLSKPSLYARGAISTNDSDLKSLDRVSSMAPGVASSGITEQSASVYGVPVTIGLGVRFYIAPRLSIGTGLDYSILTRTFTGKYVDYSSILPIASEVGDVSHVLQYIGIPLDIYYDILNSRKIKFYAHAGGEAELCVSNKYTLYSSPKITHREAVKQLQYSVGAGLGVEFSLSKHLGLYFDPGFRYYFYNNQPKSVRTDKPIMINFDLGLRFNF